MSVQIFGPCAQRVGAQRRGREHAPLDRTGIGPCRKHAAANGRGRNNAGVAAGSQRPSQPGMGRSLDKRRSNARPALHSIFAVATAAEGPAHPVRLIRGVSPMPNSARRMTRCMCRANFSRVA